MKLTLIQIINNGVLFKFLETSFNSVLTPSGSSSEDFTNSSYEYFGKSSILVPFKTVFGFSLTASNKICG